MPGALACTPAGMVRKVALDLLASAVGIPQNKKELRCQAAIKDSCPGSTLTISHMFTYISSLYAYTFTLRCGVCLLQELPSSLAPLCFQMLPETFLLCLFPLPRMPSPAPFPPGILEWLKSCAFCKCQLRYYLSFIVVPPPYPRLTPSSMFPRHFLYVSIIALAPFYYE